MVVLGYKDLSGFFHRELCQTVQRRTIPKRLFLLPRGHFKTTIITIGDTIFTILNNPNVSILIAGLTLETASAYLREIKNQFLSNKYFRFLFPEHCPSPKNIGSATDFTTPARDIPAKESTIEVIGIGGTVTGKHYDMIKKDDIIDYQSVTTRLQIKHSIDWDQYSVSLLKRPDVDREDYCGTRYHDDDLYGYIQKNRTNVDVIVRRAIENSKPIFPQRFSMAGLMTIKKDIKTFKFSCNPAEAPILMADGTLKKISDVEIGDKVIGFTTSGTPDDRDKLLVSEVEDKRSRVALVYKYKISNGDIIRCTEDHQWYSGRKDEKHKIYHTIRMGSKLIKICNIDVDNNPLWYYLGGIIDGEGSCKYGSIFIHQSEEHNFEVVKKIRETLMKLNLDYGERIYKGKEAITWYLKGGRDVKLKIIRNTKLAKSKQIMNVILNVKPKKIRLEEPVVVGVEVDKFEDVYSLKTSTGNYIAWGYASKNCQYQNEPIDDETAIFKGSWLMYWDGSLSDGRLTIKGLRSGKDGRLVPCKDQVELVNVYMLVDPATGGNEIRGDSMEVERKEDDSAVVIIAYDRLGRVFVVETYAEKVSPRTLIDVIKSYNLMYRPNKIGVECYGSQIWLVQMIREEQQRTGEIMPVFELKKDTRVSKDIRIRHALSVMFESHRVFLKENQWKLKDQILRYGATTEDDLIDGLAYWKEVVVEPRKSYHLHA